MQRSVGTLGRRLVGLARRLWIPRLLEEVVGLRGTVESQGRELRELREGHDALRSSLEMDERAPPEFQAARSSPEYRAVFERPDPLVTVCVGTYNRARLLVDRALPSILGQDHANLEVLVVGDGCTDDTAARIAALGDSRVEFVNLPRRGPYPAEPRWRWMVAGTMPFNHALQRARGDFVTHLDDDDEYLPGRISSLVRLAQAERADVVFHPFFWETAPGAWELNRAEWFAYCRVSTSSVLYHRWLARIPWSLTAWRTLEPGDWHRFRKFVHLGARIVRCPETLLRHHLERTSIGET